MTGRILAPATAAGDAAVELRRPRGARFLVLLTHGAGGRPDTADVLAVAEAAAALGGAVALVTQPYRVAGRSAPPAAGPQDAAWLQIVAAVRRATRLSGAPLVVGGRSNGARVACRTAGASGAAAVIALAFPLHPPGRPELSRLAELEAPDVPVLVLQGERDPFGMPPPGDRREVVILPGDGHSLRRNPVAIAAAASRVLTTVVGPAGR